MVLIFRFGFLIQDVTWHMAFFIFIINEVSRSLVDFNIPRAKEQAQVQPYTIVHSFVDFNISLHSVVQRKPQLQQYSTYNPRLSVIL